MSYMTPNEYGLDISSPDHLSNVYGYLKYLNDANYNPACICFKVYIFFFKISLEIT